MATTTLSIALLRPAILHILRAAGFHGARASAADALTDIAFRYIVLIAEKSAEFTQDHAFDTPAVTQVRMALEHVGALAPQLSAAEEQLFYDDDLRGLQAFAAWADGDVHKEIRRIAGLVATTGEVNLDNDGAREDYLTALKKKHSKTGEESKFQGTALGKQATDKPIKIEGHDGITSIRAWSAAHKRKLAEMSSPQEQNDTYMISAESSPLSEA